MKAPAPGTPEWCRMVTASKVGAIIGVSPWDSPLTMWLKMAGRIPWDEESEAMRRGNMLEDAVLDWWLKDHPEWVQRGRQEWHTLPDEDWCGATPDMTGFADEVPELVDAKTSSTDEHWGSPGDPDAVPPHYLASSMWQLAMAPWAERVHLAVLFGRPFTMRSYTVERDDELCGLLIDRAREFYLSLSADEPPPLSGVVAEYDAIRKAHPEIDPALTVTLPTDLVEEYVAGYWIGRHLDGVKARVLDAMGHARYGTDEHGNRIARRQPKGPAVELRCIAPDPAETLEESA